MPKSKSAVWIASYPKSGNTWLQLIIRKAGAKYGVYQGDLDAYKTIKEKREPTTATVCNPKITTVPCAILKTHDCWHNNRDPNHLLGFSIDAFVHITRNPLDVLLSYINFSKIQYINHKDNIVYQKKLFVQFMGYDKPVPYDKWVHINLEDIPRRNLDHALQYFMKSTAIPLLQGMSGTWKEHCESWFKAAKHYPFVRFRYEDLINDSKLFTNLTKVFCFTENDILSAVKAVQDNTERARNSGMSIHKIFYNKMSAYYFKDFFTPSLVSEFFALHNQTLVNFGYGDMDLFI